MRLLRGFRSPLELKSGTAVTIGNFDGVHRGHQALLNHLHREACLRHLIPVVLIFEPQPSEFFQDYPPKVRLSSLREKLGLLSQYGVSYVYCIKFNTRLASMSAPDFAEQVIYTLLNAKYLVVGDDFRFGQGREGDLTLLQKLGCKHGSIVQNFSDFYIEHQRVSSTAIRQSLQLGDLTQVAEFLGRSYSLCGRVIKGDGRGKVWGIPTANIHLNRTFLPLQGVYCVSVMQQNKPTLYGVANIGRRPTIDGEKNSLEVHLFDIDTSLYGERLHVNFLHKLRDEQKFASVDDLVTQIRGDIESARAYFSEALMRTS